MPPNIRTADVPLAVWQLASHCDEASARGTLRRRLAARVLECYAPTGGAVLDLTPSGGDVGHAALQGSQSYAVVASAQPGRGLDGFACTFDLAVVLPPDSALREGRPYRPAARVAGRAATLLRPGGILVVGLVGADGGDPLGRLVEAAGGHGLSYTQHVVALLTTAVDDPAEPGSERRVVHADVLVFTRERA